MKELVIEMAKRYNRSLFSSDEKASLMVFRRVINAYDDLTNTECNWLRNRYGKIVEIYFEKERIILE